MIPDSTSPHPRLLPPIRLPNNFASEAGPPPSISESIGTSLKSESNTKRLVIETLDYCDLTLEQIALGLPTMSEILPDSLIVFELECSSYGFFQRESLFEKFIQLGHGILSYLKEQVGSKRIQLEKLSISLHGFALGASTGPQNWRTLTSLVRGCQAKTLSLLTSDLTDVTMQDMEATLQCATYQGLRVLEIEMARWRFVKQQPPWIEAEKVFSKKLTSLSSVKNLNKLRLQLSHWYSSQADAESLVREIQSHSMFQPQPVQRHNPRFTNPLGSGRDDQWSEARIMEVTMASRNVSRFQRLFYLQLRKLINDSDIFDFQLDLRGWHPSIKCEGLKEILSTIAKKSALQNSLGVRSLSYHSSLDSNSFKRDETSRVYKINIVV